MDSDLMERVGRIVSEKVLLDVDPVTTDLLAIGALDSLTVVELLAQLQDAFDVSFDFESLEVEDFRTVARIAALVASRRRRGTAEAG
jgi:acyl carrier protein